MVTQDSHYPERDLVLLYAPPARREALAAFLALDDRLGQIVRAAREPLIGQMRLTWWHQALTALDSAPPPAEPLLTDLAAQVLPLGVSGASLATQVEGWEMLLDDPLDGGTVRAAAAARGETLFAAAATVLGGPIPPAGAGEGWALADFALHLSDPATGALARTKAMERLEVAIATPWPRPIRPLGAMVLSARANLRGRYPEGHPRRVGRLAWHRLTGR